MNITHLQVLAKLNLALHVGAPLQSGYHPVDTLCIFAAAGDELVLGKQAREFSLEIDYPEGAGTLSTGADNLVLKAAHLFSKTTDIDPCQFHLVKRVPVASGIGGGTANGAAALVLLNRRAQTPLTDEKLIELASDLGADGPVCLAPYLIPGHSFRAGGIGHDLRKGPVLPPLSVCLVNPRVQVSTAKIFDLFDSQPFPEPFRLPIVSRLASFEDVSEYIDRTRNDLESVASSFCPSISQLIAKMKQQSGSMGARMSGSGATVYGLFSSLAAAERAARRFRSHGCWSTATPIHRMM